MGRLAMHCTRYLTRYQTAECSVVLSKFFHNVAIFSHSTYAGIHKEIKRSVSEDILEGITNAAYKVHICIHKRGTTNTRPRTK